MGSVPGFWHRHAVGPKYTFLSILLVSQTHSQGTPTASLAHLMPSLLGYLPHPVGAHPLRRGSVYPLCQPLNVGSAADTG
jgi:hypothetical protein